jgi:hypothetical protein
MRTVEAASDELARVNAAIDEFRDPATGGLRRSLTLDALVGRQADVLHELSLLTGEAPLEVRFIGGRGQVAGTVSAGLLASTLSELQLAVSSAAAAQIHGERTRFGPFRADVSAQSTMRVTGFMEGSFVVSLEGPPHRGAQLTLDERTEVPAYDDALRRVLNVLEALQGDAPAAADQSVSELDSVRAIHHIRSLARSISERDTAVSIVDRSPFTTQGPREVGIRMGGAQRIVHALDATRQTSEVARRRGRLTGVRWSRASFDLELPDGTLISGRVVADLRERVQELFDREVEAEIKTTSTVGRGGVRTTHTLIGLPS